MSDLDLDAIEQQARRGLELFPDHDPYRVTGISAGYALDLVAEIMRLRDEVAEVRERIAAEIMRLRDNDDPESMSGEGWAFTSAWNNCVAHAARIARGG